MRGKAEDTRSAGRTAGITPACAGKSVAITCRAWYPRDHPRVCGEKEAGALSEVYETGSPPRVRGKVFSEGLLPVIPGDHPRVCGEKSGLMRSNATGTGSPPRVRGKDVSGADATPWIRITPACAGKSFTSMKCFRAIQDHPRVCGEKTEIAYVVFLSEGSPPRVRGKVLASPILAPLMGITPACAGKRISGRRTIHD